jgi:hypothetical protein
MTAADDYAEAILAAVARLRQALNDPDEQRSLAAAHTLARLECCRLHRRRALAGVPDAEADQLLGVSPDPDEDDPESGLAFDPGLFDGLIDPDVIAEMTAGLFDPGLLAELGLAPRTKKRAGGVRRPPSVGRVESSRPDVWSPSPLGGEGLGVRGEASTPDDALPLTPGPSPRRVLCRNPTGQRGA